LIAKPGMMTKIGILWPTAEGHSGARTNLILHRHSRFPKRKNPAGKAGSQAQSYCSNIAVQNKNEFVKRKSRFAAKNRGGKGSLRF